VSKMYFHSAGKYTIISPAAKVLTLDNGANPAEVHVEVGSHEITAKVNLASNLTISPASSTKLTLWDIDGAAGKGITLSDAGKVEFKGNSNFTGALTVNAGQAIINPDHYYDSVNNEWVWSKSWGDNIPINVGVGGVVTFATDITGPLPAAAGSSAGVAHAPAGAPSVSAVPEPGTLVLLAAGALAALAVGLRRKLGR
jgi:autotransporter-associated beta strand protein